MSRYGWCRRRCASPPFLSFCVNHGGVYQVSDALKREHQCATIQLDFQLPNNFELEYNAADGSAQRPVMIHRAILGSVERMMAVLIEHFGGRWPFWLSPRQVMVCPVSPAHAAAADALFSRLHRAGLFVDVDASDRTVPKRIQQAQVSALFCTDVQSQLWCRVHCCSLASCRAD